MKNQLISKQFVNIKTNQLDFKENDLIIMNLKKYYTLEREKIKI